MCPGAHGTQSLLPSQTRHAPGALPISCRASPAILSLGVMCSISFSSAQTAESNAIAWIPGSTPWYLLVPGVWSFSPRTAHLVLQPSTMFCLFCILCYKIIFLNSNPMASLKGVSSLPGLIYVCHELSAVRAGLLQPSPQQDKGSAC